MALAASGYGVSECVWDNRWSLKTCRDVEAVATTLNVMTVFVLWFVGFVVLSLAWLMTRRPQEPRGGSGSSPSRSLAETRTTVSPLADGRDVNQGVTF